MPRFVKQTFTGYKDVPGGASDPELEYVIHNKSEYEKLWARIRQAEREAQEAKDEGRRKVEEAYDDARRQLKKYRQEADDEANRKVSIYITQSRDKDETIEALRSDLEAVRSDLEKQRYLNSNLKRIARERANQERGLKPKKEHPGYLVLRSDQWTEKYIEDGERKEAAAWKSILQTPYNASLPLNQVKDDIYNDLRNSILSKIGFKKICGGEEDMGYILFMGEDENGQEREVNGLYRWKYRANYKAGLWELELYHTKSLRVPPELRPR